MTGHELLKVLESMDPRKRCFIKWESGDGTYDVELLDTFLDTAKVGDHFERVELLDLEDMWVLVKQRFPEKVTRKVVEDKEVLVWQRERNTGNTYETRCTFEPESLLKVYTTEAGKKYSTKQRQ